MRFMMLMIPKGYETAAPGTMPDAKAVEAMMEYNKALQEAGVLLALDGLHPPSMGARVSFKDGKPLVTDGPFAEAKEVLGGYWMIQVASKEEAIQWAMGCPASDNEMIEIRQVQEFEDFPDDIKEAAQGFCEIQSKAGQLLNSTPKQKDDNDDLLQWHFGDANSMEWQVLETGQMLKLIAIAKGTGLILSKVPPGCKGPVHIHDGLEYLYVIEGSVVSNGKLLEAGCGFIAEAGTLHEEFTSSTGATFVVVATFPTDSKPG
jgi:quercetin dioxygenase-like cupin family protein